MMDTSEIFIKQCDCEEIQEHDKKPLDWSGLQDHYYKGSYHYGILADGSYVYWTGSHFVWLPRQDELQEMVSKTKNYSAWMLDLERDFHKFAREETTTRKIYGIKVTALPINEAESMEQLWLAFVMKEKYNKTWNGKEWE